MEEKKSKKNVILEGEQPRVLKNCLSNDKVNVVFLKRVKGFPVSERSPLYGGMADSSVKVFTVPLLNNGKLANPLTNDEKECLEHIMGLEPDTLSIYHKPCYWHTSTRGATNKVRLTKDGMTLDLSNPEDYIQYKILLLNKEKICPSWDEWVRNPKPTYDFVLRKEGAEVEFAGNRVQLIRECNRKFDEFADNQSVLRCILELIEGRRLSPNTKLETLQSKVLDVINNNPNSILHILNDELITFKAFILDCVDKRIIEHRNGLYIVAETHKPLAEDFAEAHFGTAAAYLADPKNQELYYELQAKMK